MERDALAVPPGMWERTATGIQLYCPTCMTASLIPDQIESDGYVGQVECPQCGWRDAVRLGGWEML